MSYFKSGKKCIRYSLMTEYCIWGDIYWYNSVSYMYSNI
ncbi:hypothetical protein SAMN05444349_12571 [Bacteroides faecichinchillae]|uniref:Uncharacterized protein n=1 Tax=Bacteroides faecichinchillae TaxID=871325 RepID=A0A1M5CSM8_9BACE|nr:hypothetical protein SAMN05444349_12571 [Bacteroides faecichinchillae]